MLDTFHCHCSFMSQPLPILMEPFSFPPGSLSFRCSWLLHSSLMCLHCPGNLKILVMQSNLILSFCFPYYVLGLITSQLKFRSMVAWGIYPELSPWNFSKRNNYNPTGNRLTLSLVHKMSERSVHQNIWRWDKPERKRRKGRGVEMGLEIRTGMGSYVVVLNL